MVLDRHRRKNKLTSLLRQHRALTVETVARRLAPFADPDDDLTAGVDALLRATERLAAARQRDLDQADRRHRDTILGVQELRQERDKAAQELRRALVDLRETTTLLFGRRASNRLLAIKGPTPRAHNPSHLLMEARRTQGRLEDPEIRIPKPRVSLAGWDESIQRKQWIESLGTAVARLKDSSARLRRETHRTHSTLYDKGGRMSLHDQELSAVANLQEALLVLGRNPDIARTIWQKQRPLGRPARRKTGQQGGPGDLGDPETTRLGEETATSEATTQEATTDETASATSPEASSREVVQTWKS